MIIENSSVNSNEETEHASSFKDFQMGERIKKVTTHDLFQVKRNSQNFVAKLFKPEFRSNYLIQLGILRQLKHPHIIELLYCQTGNSETIGLWNCDMLILKSAQHGSLNQYIPINGKLPESVARVIFKQIISAIKYAAYVQPNGIIHPNLLPSSILIDKYRQVKICGWSKQVDNKPKTELIKNLLFNSCEILILMITNYMPFFKKNSSTDPLFKFLKPQLIHRFWQALEKRVTAKYKFFQFSKELKQLISNVFLQKWTTFQQIQDSAWMKQKNIISQEYNKILSDMQNYSREKRENSLKKLLQRQEKKRQILMNYELQTQRGTSNRSSRSSGQFDFFIQDFYDNFYSKQDVPASQCSELIRLYDDRPNFVIASLKEHLRNIDTEQINLIFGGEFKLEHFTVQKQGNQAFLQLKFTEIEADLINQEQIQQIEIKIKALIRFFKNSNNNLYAEVKILESNLSEYYASLVMSFLEQKIQTKETTV